MLNKVILQGRLTADPELKATQNGTSVTSFTLAVDRGYRSGEEQKADFIKCVAWRGAAEFICRNFSKGKMIFIDGRLEVRNWTTQDGSKRFETDVVINEAFFAGDKKADTFPVIKPSEELPEISAEETLPETHQAEFKELLGDNGELPF